MNFILVKAKDGTGGDVFVNADRIDAVMAHPTSIGRTMLVVGNAGIDLPGNPQAIVDTITKQLEMSPLPFPPVRQ